jgi:hypothetical protein
LFLVVTGSSFRSVDPQDFAVLDELVTISGGDSFLNFTDKPLVGFAGRGFNVFGLSSGSFTPALSGSFSLGRDL